jgi:uncharacterized membrane protein
MSPITLKELHVLGALLVLGTGLGTAFHFWHAHRTGNPAVIASAARGAVLADWIFTAPAVAAQPVTGWLLAEALGWPVGTPWLAGALALYALAGACWVPVVVLQHRMARLAREAAHEAAPLPAAYRRAARLWFVLGWPAFAAVLAILHLMIAKPGG